MPVPPPAGTPARGAGDRGRSTGWTPGLERLAALINEVLTGQVTPAFAGIGGLRMDVLDSPSAARATRPRPRPHPHPASATHPVGSTGEPGPSPTGIDDDHVETWRLVQLAQGGDGEAFGQLYDRYFDMVYRFIYYRVNDRALAEDFTSETFLRALRRISTITYQGRDIGAWFVTIARNIVLDHVKSARNRLEVTTGDTIEGDERAQSTESAVLEVLTSERLMQAVRQLGDEQRECVMLRFIQGLSVAETAQIMGKNDGAIKALQHRAVRKLADLIGSDLS
ncbi:MAG: sigma-70 family RNA polymerase sigma factor [Jatrophihabitans sp.]|uniref:sigma-70 family RNA polymerase sigma factor n=1 Tax=Jatrophihabitans sp. TaxID=1932789 RepID=UPI003F821780